MHLPGPGISRFAVATAAVALLLMGVGALSSGIVQGDLTGSGLPVSLIRGLTSGRYHIDLAIATGAMTVLLLIALIPSNVPGWVRATGWVSASLFAIDCAIMAWSPVPPVGAALAIPHAIVAPLFFASLVVTAYYMSLDWINSPDTVDISAWPSLLTIANLTPLAIVIQIALGAAYRHKIFSVMPHMAGAMVATLLLLVLSVQLLQNFPTNETLRPTALAAMSALLLQVTLGIAIFVMRLLDFDTSTVFAFLAAAHICVGALTLAASVVLSLEVRRCCVVSGSLAGTQFRTET
ncbi:MAG TPA: hypothetical protein VG273_11610 [Bryobacteraceae bacterium]|jgi:hypothetical protein|nr:hypothetical protein [Bryobacteraceae bacterium]